ncbi:MAG: histidine phosphatase family protein [Chloroflexi bacterium]|nr:histidine phosphatase family protein [Chloroflexota bacterium]
MTNVRYPSVASGELVLVRHGTTIDNLASRWSGWQDSPLSDNGRLQAAVLAAYLADAVSADALYASPLRRALATATVIGERLGLAPRVHAGLKESHFGQVEGMPDAEVRRLYPEMYAAAQDFTDLDFCWPGGESRRQFVARIRRTLGEIIQESVGRRVLVVGHGGMISIFLADLLDDDPSRWPKYKVNNCSVTRLELSHDGPRLALLNYCDHLENGPPGLSLEARAAPPLWRLPHES